MTDYKHLSTKKLRKIIHEVDSVLSSRGVAVSTDYVPVAELMRGRNPFWTGSAWFVGQTKVSITDYQSVSTGAGVEMWKIRYHQDQKDWSEWREYKWMDANLCMTGPSKEKQ